MNKYSAHRSIQKSIHALHTLPFERRLAKDVLLHSELEPAVAREVIQHLGAKRILDQDIYGIYLHGLARKGDVENVSKGIEYGRRHGLSNNVDFEDVLATLALVTNNFPEVFQRLLNLHDNGNAQNFMTDTFAEVVKFMGYKKEIIDELERAWQGVRAIRKREPFIIVDFFKQLRRVYAKNGPTDKGPTDDGPTDNRGDEGNQSESIREVDEDAHLKSKSPDPPLSLEQQVESLRTKNEHLLQEINSLRTKLFNIKFSSSQSDNKAIIQDWIEESNRDNLVVDNINAQSLLERLDVTDEEGMRYFFQEMKRLGVTLSMQLFYPIIRSEQVNLKAKERWVEVIKKEGLKPTRVIFLALVKSAAETGEEEKIRQWMTEMQKDGVDAIAYNAILQKYLEREGGEGVKDKIVYWMDDMRSHKVAPNEQTYAWLIQHAATTRDKELAQRWMNEADKAKIAVGMDSYHRLIEAAGEMEDKEWADHLVEKLIKVGWKPNVRTNSLLLVRYMQAGKREEAKKCLKEVRADGFKLSMDVYAEVFKVLMKEGDKKGAVEWLTEMKRDALVPDEQLIGQLRMLAKQQNEQEARETKSE